MPWQTTWRSRHMTAQAALAQLGVGAQVYLGGNAATPRHLARILAERADLAPGMTLSHVLLLGDD
ncbi:MAG TPA: 4-hydroxybutyrate CoA-transferase, partial [Deltaproteobacteria bacterium]|nr:4-hydroxybutyrate CoA-transferase [Deltaproteobacteria bacterium]